MNDKGLSYIEILVSSILVAIVLVGLANLFFVAKRYVALGGSKGAGMELGKRFLDPLQMQVRQDTWGAAGNDLSATAPYRYCDDDGSTPNQTNCPSQAQRTVNNVIYTSRYDIGNPTVYTVRRVQALIQWTVQ